MRIILNECAQLYFHSTRLDFGSLDGETGLHLHRHDVVLPGIFAFSRVCVPPPRPETRRPATDRHRSTAGERAGMMMMRRAVGRSTCARAARAVWDASEGRGVASTSASVSVSASASASASGTDESAHRHQRHHHRRHDRSVATSSSLSTASAWRTSRKQLAERK